MTAPGVGQVLLLALLTAVATGLGALPFLVVRDLTRGWLGVSNALASGLMLAASFGLVYEGAVYGLGRTLLGVVEEIIARARWADGSNLGEDG